MKTQKKGNFPAFIISHPEEPWAFQELATTGNGKNICCGYY